METGKEGGLLQRIKETISGLFNRRKVTKMDEKELMMLDGRLLNAIRDLLTECRLKATYIADLALRKRSLELWRKVETSVLTYIERLLSEIDTIPTGHVPTVEERGILFKKYKHTDVVKPRRSMLIKAITVDILLATEIESVFSALGDLEKDIMLDGDLATSLLTKLFNDLMRIEDIMTKRKNMSLRPVDAAAIYQSLRNEYAKRFDDVLKHMMEDEIAELDAAVKRIMHEEGAVEKGKELAKRFLDHIIEIGQKASRIYGGLMALPDLYVRLREEGIEIGPEELILAIKNLADMGLVKLRDEGGIIFVDFLIDLAEDKLKVLNLFKEKGLEKLTLSEIAELLNWTIERVEQVMMALEKDGIIAKAESFMEEPCFYLKASQSNSKS